jgi:hypothetical protein
MSKIFHEPPGPASTANPEAFRQEILPKAREERER